MFSKLIFSFFVLCSFCGCQQTGLYQWGHYETSVNKLYISDKYSPEEDAEKLTEDIRKIEEKGLGVPPGQYAHLGMIHLKLGHKNLAIEHFQKEAHAFPESKKFMDDLIAKVENK